MKKYFVFFVAIFSALLMAYNNDGKNNFQKNDTATLKKDSPEQVTKNDQWEKDCVAFIQTLTDLAPKASNDSSDSYIDKFKNKKVEWDLTFKKISKSDKGEYQLEFDLEPFGIKYKFFSGKPVMMNHFKPAAGTVKIWQNVKPDSQVKISVTIVDVFFVTMTPGDNPDKYVPAAVVTVEDTKIMEH